MTSFDYAILFGYLGAMALMGLWFSRRNTSTEQYFLGGRSVPGWAIGLSMVGTSISSVTFVSFPGDAYKTGWLRFLPNLALPLVILMAAYLILPFYRKAGVTTAYQYLESRFGPSVRAYVASVYMLAQIVRVSIILYLVSLVVHEMTGMNAELCVITAGVFVAFYTIVGGIDAVIWTDVIQTIVLIVGGIVCLCSILMSIPGGISEVLHVAMAHDKFTLSEMTNGVASTPSWGFSISEKTISMMILLGAFTYLREYCGGQNTVQRYVAAKSTYEARKAMLICATTNIPIWAGFMFLGTCLFVYYHVHPDPRAAAMLTGESKAEQILPFYVITQLPPGLTGLIIAAITAAAMSSLDSSINSISTVFVVDIYRRYFVKNRTDRHYLKVAWCAATIVGLIMIGGAVLLHEVPTKTLQDTGTIIVSLMGGGLLGIYCVGFFTRRGNARSVWLGIACTLLFVTWTLIAKNRPDLLPHFLKVPFDLYYTDIFGNLIMFFVGYCVGALWPDRQRDVTGLTVWDK
ncbi:MAG: sodium:solute symporter [Phycisphaeraceae bacterium]|nr:sodium:solute symporter [Phycisphaeraceae bacterium]